MNEPFLSTTDTRAIGALNRVLGSVEALRNGRALYLLLFAFTVAGMLLAFADAALSRDSWPPAALCGGAALTTLFYGSNAAGLVLMDEARGLASRPVGKAFRDALSIGHRLLLVLLTVLLGMTLLLATLAALLWATRMPWVGCRNALISSYFFSFAFASASWVCCSGCRDEFKENPEKYIKK